MNKKILLLSVLTLSLVVSCGEEETTTPSTGTTTPSDGSQSAAELAGTGQACSVFAGSGTSMNGLGYTRTLTLNSNGTYSYSVYFSDHTGCSTTSSAGGNNIATYSQTGTYTVKGTTGTPSTGTKVDYVIATSLLTVYNTASTGFVNALNSCSPNPGFTQGSTTSNVVWNSNTVCIGSSSYDIGAPPTIGATLTGIAYKAGGILQTGTRIGIYSPGSNGYSTSYGENWLNWH